MVIAKEAKKAFNPDSYLEMNPSWRVAMLELCDPYGWHELSLQDVRTVRDRLSAFERMTWREILIDAAHQNHHIPLERLSREAQNRLEELGQEVDELLSLRVSGAERVFGILDREVFRIIFWDPDHRICPVNVADN